MEHTVSLYSKVFLDSNDPNDWSNVAIDRSLWEDIHRIQTPLFYGDGGTLPAPTNHRYFLRFITDNENENEINCVIAIGNPVMGNVTDEKKVYMPQWLLDRHNFQGEGESYHVEILTEEAFPEATKIVLRVVDSAFYNSDIKKELELALTRLGVIEKGQLLHVPIDSLDNFAVDIYVSELEPATIVLCQGEEVVVEFEEPVDAIVERPLTPVPEEVETILPVNTGNVLGSDPSSIPEWRRGIPPPPRR
jgi:hypothetical protein